jgi:hypothetical protein
MIEFRCWHCNRFHSVPDRKARERLDCHCGHRLRVPRTSGGECRGVGLGGFLLERSIYAIGGGLLGFAVGLFLFGWVFHWWPIGVGGDEWLALPMFIATLLCALVGLAAGLLFGERGINSVGRLVRSLWEG